MKNLKKPKSKNYQDSLIQKAIRTGGFIFPETIEEVKEFERIYGATDVILPEKLKEPNFLYSKGKGKKKSKAQMVTMLNSDNLAMAAREGTINLPLEIQKRMAADRKKADAKKGNSKKWNKA